MRTSRWPTRIQLLGSLRLTRTDSNVVERSGAGAVHPFAMSGRKSPRLIAAGSATRLFELRTEFNLAADLAQHVHNRVELVVDRVDPVHAS